MDKQKHNLLTVTFPHNIQVQLRVLWIKCIELENEVPDLRSDLPLIGDIAKRVGDVGEPRASWLVDVEQVDKRVPA